MGLFSFGKQKSKTSGEFDEQSSGTQFETGSQSQSSTGTQNTASTSTTNNQSATQGVQTGVNVGSQQQTTQQQTAQFSNETLAALDSFLQSSLGTAGLSQSAGAQGLDKALGALESFDPSSFVANLVAGAATGLEEQADTTNQGFASAVGGDADNNSMAALLKAKTARDNAAALSGIEANASKEASSIFNNLLSGVLGGVEATGIPALSQLASVVKGGVTTQEGSAQATSQDVSQQATTSNTQQTSQTQAQENVSTEELVNSLFQQLGIFDQDRSGTSKEKTKSGGFGLSI